jgi:endonuclease-8
MPEGDTILSAARRVGAALVGKPIVAIETPQSRHALDRWPERLGGRAVNSVDARGKHLFIRFEGDLTLHSHLRMTDSRTRFDRRLAALGPDVLAPDFDERRFLELLRADDQSRGTGEALLDQRNVAGVGNMWKAEGCFLAGIDPWRRLSDLSDAEALAVLRELRPLMQASIRARGQGDDTRTTYWCPACQA